MLVIALVLGAAVAFSLQRSRDEQLHTLPSGLPEDMPPPDER